MSEFCEANDLKSVAKTEEGTAGTYPRARLLPILILMIIFYFLILI